MTTVKENIVVVQFPGFSHACLFSICYPTGQHKQIFLPVTDLFKDPSKCFEFFEKLTSLVPVKLIKGLVLLAKVPFPLNVIQKVKRNFQKFCESYGIFYYFPTTDMINDYEMLRDIKPNIANGDYVSIVNPLEDVNFRVLKRTGRYIEFQEESLIPISSLAAFKTSVMAKYNLKQLLFIKCSEGNRLEALMRDTGEEVVRAFPDVPIAYNAAPDPHHRLNMTIESCIELLLLEMGEKAGSRFVTKPFFDRDIEISSTLIKCKYGDLLPFEKSVIQKVADAKNLTLREPKCGLLENIAFISTDAKEVKITLSVDTNMFYKVRVQPVTETPKEEIIALSFEKNIKIKDTVARMAKVVFTYDHFSVYVMEDGEEEKMIKDSDGSTKIPLYISFMEKKPVIGESAAKVAEKNPDFVVYDLMKLCSINFENADPKWPFKLIRNYNNEMLVEFETSNGPRKAGPDFLLAIIFNHCLKLIEKETGEKLEEIGIEFEDVEKKEDFVPCFMKAVEKINVKPNFL